MGEWMQPKWKKCCMLSPPITGIHFVRTDIWNEARASGKLETRNITYQNISKRATAQPKVDRWNKVSESDAA